MLTSYRDGTTHVILEPLDFIARLASLMPKPRVNLTRFHCVFAISKPDWIRQQQTKLQKQERDTAREYLDRESHYLWGKRYMLEVIEKDAAPKVELKHSQIVLEVCPGADRAKREAVLYN